MNREQLKRIWVTAGIAYAITLTLLLTLLIASAVAEQYNLVYQWNELRVIKTFSMQRNGVEQGEVSLPLTLDEVSPGERITLITNVKTEIHDCLLVKTEGAPMKLFIDSNLYASDGDPGTYPTFQKSPSPNLLTVNLPEEASGKEIRIDYVIPESLDDLTLPVIYLGDNETLFTHLVSANGFSFGVGFLLSIGGVVLITVTLLIRRRVPVAGSLLWLGMACFAVGVWGFCSNDLAIYLVPAQNLLYAGTCIGLLSFTTPFLMFAQKSLDLTHKMPLMVVYTSMRIVFFLALVAHLTGLFPFTYSVPYLQFFPPIALLFLIGYILFEYIAYRNPSVRNYAFPYMILALCVFATIVNHIVPFVQPDTILFQVGIFVFAVWTAIIGWNYVRTVFEEAERSAQLELEVDSMNRNLEMQRYLYKNLTQATEEVRVIRHDLRHQLRAIRGYLEKGNITGALGYVDAISGTIPEIANKLLCDNFAVNAVAVHYYDMAQKDNIQTDIKLVVPEDLGQIPDNDMSIIVGNLFENAIEACQFVDEDKRFIRMSSKVAKNRITLVIDNSFDGKLTETNGQFVSRKRRGTSKGIGISSVRAIVEKNGGSLKHETADGVFMTSLYVKM
jgi:hypothetical protein